MTVVPGEPLELENKLREVVEGCSKVVLRGGTWTGSGKGEHYCSRLLRLEARMAGRPAPLLLVAKLLPGADQQQSDIFNPGVAFKKEVEFYESAVPVLREWLPGELFPRLYGARLAPGGLDADTILVLEDLSAAGFRLGSRRSGLDVQHCSLALRGLAALHAAGVALKRRRPTVFWGDAVAQGPAVFFLHDRTPEEARRVRLDFREVALRAVERDVPALQPLLHRLRRAVLDVTEGRPPAPREPFCTLCHADCWTNNFMFAYDEQARSEPREVRLIDFQLTLVDSPVGDVLFFLYTSANADTLEKHLDRLLREYHDTFCESLRVHGLASEDLNWGAFKEEVEAVAPRALSNLFAMLRVVFADQEVDLDSAAGALSPAARDRYVQVVADWATRGWI